MSSIYAGFLGNTSAKTLARADEAIHASYTAVCDMLRFAAGRPIRVTQHDPLVRLPDQHTHETDRPNAGADRLEEVTATKPEQGMAVVTVIGPHDDGAELAVTPLEHDVAGEETFLVEAPRLIAALGSSSFMRHAAAIARCACRTATPGASFNRRVHRHVDVEGSSRARPALLTSKAKAATDRIAC